jgi:hypothetical protein
MLHGVEIPRLMWTLFEPIHAVVYFAPEARQGLEAAGLRGFWRGYFACRTAPLGPVVAGPVIGAFFSFAPGMVGRALPQVWQLASPEEVLRARSAGAAAALARLADGLPAAVVAEVADGLAEAAGRADTAGRVLGAANAALPAPEDPLARLWQAATTLREHRGDGHTVALVAAGLGGCEVLAWRAAHDLSRDALQPFRGWDDQEWEAATRRLVGRGWLDAAGRPTRTGVDQFREVEAVTDRLAAGPWAGVDTDRLRRLLTPIARACRAAIPAINPIGLPVDAAAELPAAPAGPVTSPG